METNQRNCGQRADPNNLTRTQVEALRQIWAGTLKRRGKAGGSQRRMLERMQRANLITRNATRRLVLTNTGKNALGAYDDKRSGKCRVCGCTDEQACPGGCAWAPGTRRTLCTSCAP
jgi:hypothetical protein